MKLEKVFEKNQEWIEKKLSIDPGYFQKLSKGQNPEILYIGCSDSRVTAEELMGLEPGDAFVHRNIANQVIPIDSNINAVIQYAVEYLHVRHIVVCGHYECGGIKAALEPSDMGQLNSWLKTIRDVYRLHRKELDAIQNAQEKFDRLVELNVQEQCLNVMKIDHVQRSWYKTKLPKIHGWVFDVRTGKIIDLKIDVEREFNELISIYGLNITEE